jgi:hypothetical protein
MSATESNQIIPSSKEMERRPSIMQLIKEKQNDQDFNQKLNVAITLVMELFKVLMGAFLVVFVPQKCGDGICSINQNINRDDDLSKSAISFNIITALSFLALYFVEVKRENKMINYLEVNRFTPVDNESVGKALEKLSSVKKQNIWDYDGYYQKAGYTTTAAFIINAILSIIVLHENYLDSKTVTVFLTNILLMGLKVADVFSTVNTKKNVFYSAYLKNKVQFNDVDPDKIQLIADEEQTTDVTETTPINITDSVELSTTGSHDIESNEESIVHATSQQKVDITSQSVDADGSIDVLTDVSVDGPIDAPVDAPVDVDMSTNSHEIFQDSHPEEEKSEDNAVELPTTADNSV